MTTRAFRRGFRRRNDGRDERGDRPMKSAIGEQVNYLSDDPKAKRIQKRRSLWRLIKLPVYGAFAICGAFLLFRSFGIYQVFFSNAGLRTIGGVCSALQPFPLLGWVLSAGCDTVSRVIVGSIALVTLIALTALMSIPVLLYFDPAAIEGMVHQLRDNRKEHQAIALYTDDGQEVQNLVQRHKKLPDKALRTLALLSVVAFLVEAAIVYFVRGPKASIITVLIDSLGLEMLLIAFFSFRNAFLSKPKQARVVD
ncbi:MAG TPA: hypothetical protein IGS53_04810 [Leptolyngbyaceae cyanobacterium M33_DOE_097]|uniref:Uncharacterized protein n=1 Tax=Oscillatoriales cyanobacterium SpSt-418 TaxID=2282169 RepID=A0A7C3KDW6_9CYAN|nr:hypothetical protein [Leptolyngbyaceae cyanobacterium M33_DOE_097]